MNISHSNALWSLTSLYNCEPNPINCWLFSCEFYVWGMGLSIGKLFTSTFSCLGHYGPLSAIGPLGPLGPIGKDLPTPKDVMDSIGNWEDFKKLVMGGVGPLDAPNGPLSKYGPLGSSFWDVMPYINDFTLHMQGLGIWSVLGPIGPLGALGALGPLGPIGSHGYNRSKGGSYYDSNNRIVTKIKALYDDKTNTWVEWPLFEYYTSEHANILSLTSQLDTSFAVQDIANSSVGTSYYINSHEDQFITIVVVPDIIQQIFEITLKDINGRVLTSTANYYHINWIQMNVSNHKNTRYIINVRSLYFTQHYTIYVVGSTKFMLRREHIGFKGNYIMDVK